MNVFFPTTSPPSVTTDASSAHDVSTDVAHASVVSSTFTGTLLTTFSAPSLVSKTSSGFPASAVICNPAAALSCASSL